MSEFNEKVAAMITKEVEMVTIPKAEYELLKDKHFELECLEAAGVDNWGGYDYAMEMYNEEEE